jgi:subtilisin-like proprotein convertase family protein
MWEESPIGTWTLEVLNDGRSIVELKEWSIAFLVTIL